MSSKAAPKTLASEWARLRVARGISQRELGKKTGLSNVTPWKVENGKHLRWETIHLLLKDGLDIRPGSPDYELVHRLWLESREERADNQPEGHAKRNPDKHVQAAVSRFRRIIKHMTADELDRFMGKVDRIKTP